MPLVLREHDEVVLAVCLRSARAVVERARLAQVAEVLDAAGVLAMNAVRSGSV